MTEESSLPDRKSNVLSFNDAAQRAREVRMLRSEATKLAAARGPNPYSDFLTKNGRRPSVREAVVIGRLLNTQVRAADGSLQPRRKKRGSRKTGTAETEGIDQLLRLRSALAILAANQGDPADAIPYISAQFGDDSVIREQLAHAVNWINGFAKEWGREQETRGGPRAF